MFQKNVKIFQLENDGKYVVKVKKWYSPFWKTVCYAVDEFDDAPYLYDNRLEAISAAVQIIYGEFGKYLLR